MLLNNISFYLIYNFIVRGRRGTSTRRQTIHATLVDPIRGPTPENEYFHFLPLATILSLTQREVSRNVEGAWGNGIY